MLPQAKEPREARREAWTQSFPTAFRSIALPTPWSCSFLNYERNLRCLSHRYFVKAALANECYTPLHNVTKKSNHIYTVIKILKRQLYNNVTIN